MGSAGLASTTEGSTTVASGDAVPAMVLKLHFYLDELDIYERAVLWWRVAGMHAELINGVECFNVHVELIIGVEN